MAVPQTHFDVYTKIIIKITCGGEFWASLSSTTISIALTMTTDAAQQLYVSSATGSVQFGQLSVYHKMHSFLCKVGEDITVKVLKIDGSRVM
jgi:hypothetical protein